MSIQKHKNSFTFLIWTAVLCIIPLIFSSDYSRYLCINALIAILLAQGLNLCFGYCGQLSLGQAGLYAIGGYIFALLTTKLGFCWWGTAIISVIATALIGFLLALVSAKSIGAAFIVISILFARIVGLVALNWTDMTNGQAGILNVPGLTLFGNDLTSKLAIYYFILVFVVVIQIVISLIIDSKIGRAFKAIRQDKLLASSLGISPSRYSIAAFTMGAAITALAGCFHASFAQMVSPDMADFGNVMLYIIMMVVVGGRGTLWGPVVGAFIFTLLPEYLRFTDMLRLPIFGLILILFVLFVPDGLVPACAKLVNKIKEVINKKTIKGDH